MTVKRKIVREARILTAIVPPTAAGALLGYAVLHPLSVVIVYLFERRMFDGVSILSESFALEHIAMGIYFALIGGFIGFLFAVYRRRVLTTNRALAGIVRGLQSRNKALIEKIREESGDPELVGRLWTSLNKIDKGIGLISSGGMGELTERQTMLLEITREYIEELYRLVESGIPSERKRPDANQSRRDVD